MAEVKKFDEKDLEEALRKVGSELHRKISIYLIGGCAMTFMGRKAATKDVDIIFSSTKDIRDFASAMEKIGFVYVQEPGKEYDALGAWVIMEDSKGMRFDLFDRQVCRALEISRNMHARATQYKDFGNLKVYLMSPEDILLFKGVTEREADLDDMRILAERGLEWKTVQKECLSQKQSGKWAYMLGTKLLELKSKFGIDAPIIRTLMDHSDVELLRQIFTNIIAEGNNTFKEISKVVRDKYGYSESWTRKQLNILVQKGVIVIRKNGKKHVFSVAKQN
jgi:hypothetical protein